MKLNATMSTVKSKCNYN